MRYANRLLIGLVAAALTACSKPADENEVAIDINNAAPGDIEQLPPDESVDTSSEELANGAADAEADTATEAANNAY